MLSVVTASHEHSESMAEIAKQALELGFTSVYWLLNDTVTDDSKGEVVQYWGEQYLKVKVGDKLSLNIGPNNFCQNNIEVFEEILSYVDEHLARNDLFTGKLYDLYAGVGAIGLYFAQKFEQVYACELDAQSVELARLNAVENGISNYEIVAADATTLGALATPDVVIVDPPRAGLLPRGVEEVLSLGAKSLVYISCNPTTQAQDLAALSSQYKIVSARAFDMFPQTPHVENVVILEPIND
ncbi:MAG: class I SAM-dependent RNA methyltransferase [Candidatus Doudnabacteria bacterium]|nr:class I SAM-dependent RNA methyltransferase [Candidatus Doudnabacteria bacterium]